MKWVLAFLLAVGVLGVRQNCVPVRNPLSNEYICTRIQKWINDISALGDKATCSQMVDNDLIEAFSTVTEADDCSLNWPTPEYEEPYIKAYAAKISNAYQKYKPQELRNLAGSILQTNTETQAAKSLKMRLYKMLMQRAIDGGAVDDALESTIDAADSASVSTEVHYIRMTAEEYLTRIQDNLPEDCSVPRWPCCSELLRKLEEQALAKQLAQQAAAAAAAASAAASGVGGTGGGSPATTTTESSSTAPSVAVVGALSSSSSA